MRYKQRIEILQADSGWRLGIYKEGFQRPIQEHCYSSTDWDQIINKIDDIKKEWNDEQSN